MDNNLTDLIIILDSSSSMQKIKSLVEEGLTKLVNDQKQEAGKCLFSLVEFSDTSRVLHDAVDIQQVNAPKFNPNGWTALYDAVGDTIDRVGARLASTPESKRPGLVTVWIFTDGEENSSKRFSAKEIHDKIKHQETNYNWKFNFLGTNQDVFTESGAIGINAKSAASYSVKKLNEVFAGMSGKVSQMRSMSMNCCQVDNSFSEAELRSMQDGI